MIRYRWTVVLLPVVGVAPSTARAQRLPPRYASARPGVSALVPQDSGTAELPDAGAAIVGSVAGGVAGTAAGYAIGYVMLYLPSRAADLGRGCEDCGLAGALETAALMGLAEAVGVAAGAHLGDGRRGRFGSDLAASAGTLVLGALVAGAVASQAGVAGAILAGAVPAAQIVVVVSVERHTARTRGR